MKGIVLMSTILASGTVLSPAQSNPGSPGAVDLETQLAWPDGVPHLDQVYRSDTQMITGLNGEVTYRSFINWQETAGGNGKNSRTVQYPDQYFGSSTNLYNWLGGRWPELGGVMGGDAPGFVTSVQGDPFGALDFTSSDGKTAYHLNQQAQAMLITGGEPGSTDSELYRISGGATAISYTDQTLPDGIANTVPPGQIQIGSLGTLDASGGLWTALPMHCEVPVTPHVNSAPYSDVSINAQPYPLVSQCVATTPANRSRTTIGVGEEVDINFNPTPLTDYTNFAWSTTAGSLLYTHGSVTRLTAPSHAAHVKVTGKLFGKPGSITFNVIEPSGYDHAQLIATNHYPVGVAAACMTNIVWISPTIVSFYRVNIMEVGTDATNITGYFSQWTPQQLHHSTADHWTRLNQANWMYDGAGSISNPPPWYGGSYSWDIPARWQVIGTGATNSMMGWSQTASIGDSGTVTVQKFRHSVTRTVDDVITTQ